MTHVGGPGPEQLRELAARLKVADPVLKRQLRRNLRNAVKPAAQAAKDSILAMPSKHDGHLREALAKSVTVSTSITGRQIQIDIVQNGKKLEATGQGTLGQLFDSDKGFRHPVYANPDLPRQKTRHRIDQAMAELLAEKYHGQLSARELKRLRELAKAGIKTWTWVHQIGKPGWFHETIRRHAPEFERGASGAVDETAAEVQKGL